MQNASNEEGSASGTHNPLDFLRVGYKRNKTGKGDKNSAMSGNLLHTFADVITKKITMKPRFNEVNLRKMLAKHVKKVNNTPV